MSRQALSLKCFCETALPVAGKLRLQQLSRLILSERGFSGHVNLIFGDDALIRSLNHMHRGLDKVTDVLSYHYPHDPEEEAQLLEEERDCDAEVYVSVPQVKRQAPRWNNDEETELRRVVIHGILHIAGFDHKKAKDAKVMRAWEEHYLALKWPPQKTQEKKQGKTQGQERRQIKKSEINFPKSALSRTSKQVSSKKKLNTKNSKSSRTLSIRKTQAKQKSVKKA